MLSKYSLLFTKKPTVILFACGAIFSVFILILGTAQILISYANHEGFDVTPSGYYSTLLVYVPFYITNGLLLRFLIERWRILRRSKKIIHIAEYDAPEGFTPAHAGLLIDNDIQLQEVVATIYDLERRGVLVITNSTISLPITAASVTKPEKQLIGALFAKGSTFYMNPSNKGVFLAASEKFRKAVLADMRHHEMVPMPVIKSNYLKVLLTLIFTVASYVSIVLFIFLIKSPNYILMVQYPRYSMQLGEPIVGVLLVMLVLAVAATGYFSNTFTTKGRFNWRFAAGYRLYIETVFKDKFDYGAKGITDKEMKKALPYAIAFSIETKPANDFVRKLGL